MEKCELCGASAYEDCDAECVNWDTRYDEIWGYANSLEVDLDDPGIEVEWK